jgi:hypothetical protein
MTSRTHNPEIECWLCGYHYRRSRMYLHPLLGKWVCRDKQRCDQNIATRRHFDEQKARKHG